MNFSYLLPLVIISLISVVSVVHAGVQCLDQSGSPVDWWVILKFPQNASTTNPVASSGYGYAYLDARSKTLKNTGLMLNKNGGGLQKTLEQIYLHAGDTNRLAWAMYNDNTALCGSNGREDCGMDDMDEEEFLMPRGDSYAHAKGIVGFDQNTGFWILHSAPRFPRGASNRAFLYPSCAADYGQSFICISLSTKSMETVGYQMRVNHPNVYDKNIPEFAKSILNIPEAFTNGGSLNNGASSVQELKTLGGMSFTSFAKCAKWSDDLYYGLVAPHYNTDLYAETWMRSPVMPTYCKPRYKYNVFEISNLAIDGQIAWAETKDHSKWAIGSNGAVVCVGDINRMTSQFTRGGGTMCFKDTTVYNSFKSIIAQTFPCDTPAPKDENSN